MSDMETTNNCGCEHRKWKYHKCRPGGASCAIYGFGLIGAAVYYFQHADSFMMGVGGLVKAIGWPAVLLYKVLQMLRM